ncbi:MAG: hypothetical protein K6A81_09885 [Clostridiales bacterium]|nr:hypothetical protein [Clostridiales bacterium]
MRDRKIISAVLIVAVVLGIVGCKAKGTREIVEDDIEITTATVEAQKETTEEKEESTKTSETTKTAETTVSDTVAPSETEAAEPSVSESEAIEPTESEKKEPTKDLSEDPATTEAPKATATPVPTEAPKPTESPVPTATPDPTATPTSTPTPTLEPTPFDIDKSAKEHGYSIIDIDMGGGQTQRIYGYYVDMSGLATKINDYRESLGLSRLPTDSACISEMKLRAAEATVKYSHWRPNGQGGQEANLAGRITPNEAYQDLYASDPHRTSWEDQHLTSIYCVGFRRVEYLDEIKDWTELGSATIVYFGDDLS